MAEIEQFLQYLQEQFKEIDLLLTEILKEEQSVHDEALFKKGFIVHTYHIKYGALNLDIFDKIIPVLEKVLTKEVQMQGGLEKHSKKLEKIETDYRSITKKKLHANLLSKYIGDLLYYCNLMITRIKQTKPILKEEIKLHKKSLPAETEIFFASFENVGTKVIGFIRVLEQLTSKILNFETNAYYPEPKTYGRVMSPVEYKKTIAKERLSSSKDPTPVFDAPKSVIKKINLMSKDQMKNYFRQIGVVGGINIVFFQTKLKPINHEHPITQSNGLREYKFPKGLEIEILQAA